MVSFVRECPLNDRHTPFSLPSSNRAVTAEGVFPAPLITGRKGDRFLVWSLDSAQGQRFTDPLLRLAQRHRPAQRYKYAPCYFYRTCTSLCRNSLFILILNKHPKHWHGLFQAHTPEMDGPSFVTQCPLVPGESFL